MTTITTIQPELPGLERASRLNRPLMPPAETAPVSKPKENFVSGFIDAVNQLQMQSGALEKNMYEGGPTDLHSVMIAAEEAGTAVELLVEIRNRLVETYQELMRMPV